MAEAARQEQTPTPEVNYILPKVTLFKPIVGELITRPIGYRSSNIFPKDPWAIRRGRETYKYADAALHPQVATSLRLVVNGPFWTPWSYHADNDYERYPEFEARDKEIIWLLNYQTKAMRYESFTNVLKSIWKDSVVHGFAMGEKVFHWDGDYWIIRSIKTHSPFLFDLKTDKGNNLDQIYYGDIGLTVPRQLLPKFIVPAYPYLEHGKYYGTSRLQSIYFDVQMLKLLEQAQSEGIRAVSIKPIMHYYASEKKSDEDFDRVKTALWTMDSGSVVDLPATQNAEGDLKPYDDYKVMEDRASPTGIALISEVLDVIYKRITRLMGTPDDLGFTTTSVGSRAKAQEETPLFALSLGDDQAWIENMVDRDITPSMVKYNYPSWVNDRRYNLPKFRFGSIEEEADSQTINNLIDMEKAGFLNLQDPLHWEYIQERLKIPKAAMPTIDPDEIIAPDQSPDEEGRFKRLFRQIIHYRG